MSVTFEVAPLPSVLPRRPMSLLWSENSLCRSTTSTQKSSGRLRLMRLAFRPVPASAGKPHSCLVSSGSFNFELCVLLRRSTLVALCLGTGSFRSFGPAKVMNLWRNPMPLEARDFFPRNCEASGSSMAIFLSCGVLDGDGGVFERVVSDDSTTETRRVPELR